MSQVTTDSKLSGFLAELSIKELDALRARGWRRRFQRGATLFNEGESSEQIVAVVSGRVKISHFTNDGREVVLAIRGAGELLGDMSWVDREPRSATGIALDPVEALIVTVDDFTDFIASTPRVALLLLQNLTRRLRDADRKRIEFAAYDTVGRVARRLLELGERFGEPEPTGGGVRITLPLSQQELAGWIGSSREAVSKALQMLRKRGLIETHRRGISVLDADGLAKRATF